MLHIFIANQAITASSRCHPRLPVHKLTSAPMIAEVSQEVETPFDKLRANGII